MTITPDESERGGPPASKRGSATHTPGRMATPPPPADRAHLEVKRNSDMGSSRPSKKAARETHAGRASLDVDAVDQELCRQSDRSQREPTPGASPSRKRQRINGDR